MLSIALAACSPKANNALPPPPVAVAVEIRDTPPADLLTCPARPAPFPAATAEIPQAVRAALIGLAGAYRDAADRLARLVAWHRPGACQDKP